MPDGPLAVVGEGRLVTLTNGAELAPAERARKKRKLKLSPRRHGALGRWLGGHQTSAKQFPAWTSRSLAQVTLP